MSSKSKFFAILALSLAMSSGALAQETLKIGAPQPMTGPDAPFGDKFKKAYSMRSTPKAGSTATRSRFCSRTIRPRIRSPRRWPRS